MEVRAVAKYVRVQPRKVRIVADEVRGKGAVHAAHLLRFHPSKSARLLRKVLISAIANASENNGLAAEGLKISRIQVDEGPRLKRIQARAMGRAFRIIKKTSHITVVVEDGFEVKRIKPHGTQPKKRPTLTAPKPKAKKKEDAPVVEAEAAAIEPTEEQVVETPEAVEASTQETVEEVPAPESVEAVESEGADVEEVPAEEAPAEEVAEAPSETGEESATEESKEEGN